MGKKTQAGADAAPAAGELLSDQEGGDESVSTAEKNSKSGPNAKAGLSLKISRVTKRLKGLKATTRLNNQSKVFATGVVEAVLSQILSDSAVHCLADSKTRITTRHISKAVRTHPEIARAFSGFVFTFDNTLPKPGDSILTGFDIEARNKKRQAAREKAAASS